MHAETLHRLFDLSGRVAVVTGGSRGLGFQIASALGEYGATIALAARKRPELDEAVAALAEQGIVARGFSADLGEQETPAVLTEAVMENFGRIDILVNNAGVSWGARAQDHPLEAWNRVLNLNLTGLFLLTQVVANKAFLPQGKGAVVNIASIMGMIGAPPGQMSAAAYSSAKGAVISLTRALAAEWGPNNIRVNGIAPGFFPSKMTTAILDRLGDNMVEMTPLGKLGGPADLMGAALLLASDAGDHITGQTIVVDGGMTII